MQAPLDADQQKRFRAAYAAQRASEGRATSESELLSLPYLTTSHLSRQWSVRARSYERLMRQVIQPRARELGAPRLRVLDLGAGNGWLCYRLVQAGHDAVAVDIRTDAIDGLGAAAAYTGHLDRMFARVAASFDALPFHDRAFDIVVFNASIHYAASLAAVLREAARLAVRGGRIAVVDSPFYAREETGAEMVREKHAAAAQRFGERAQDLLGVPMIEFLTRARLAATSRALGLEWRRHRVRYPLWYELRPVLNGLRMRRAPSRFDVWEAVVAS